MSTKSEKSVDVEDVISLEDDTVGSSMSFSVGENSIYVLKEASSENKAINHSQFSKEPVAESLKINMKQSSSPSPDVSSSMKEFLEKEKMCKAIRRTEGDTKDKEDTLCDILASVTFEKYPSDFENATDEDIGSMLEEMSKIAGALSPNSAPENSCESAKNLTEEEKSVEELLEEAEKLVRKNSSSLSKSASRMETLVSDDKLNDGESLNRVKQLEDEIFQLIEEEVQKESEKIKNSPKNEKNHDVSPDLEVIYENLNIPRLPKVLEHERRKLEDQKVEVSSSSDLDDPIERHSRSEESKSLKKNEENKDNLQKEITDVDKNFFEDLLKRSKDKVEGGMSGSSSLGQEDFSHFLKLLQGHADQKEHQSTTDFNPTYNFILPCTDGNEPSNEQERSSTSKSSEFPEKEFSEILQKELPECMGSPVECETIKTNENLIEKTPEKSRNAHTAGIQDRSSSKRVDATNDPKKVVNAKNELYTVGLTPRLELFADAIPKLIAQKSHQSSEQCTKEKSVGVLPDTFSREHTEAKPKTNMTDNTAYTNGKRHVIEGESSYCPAASSNNSDSKPDRGVGSSKSKISLRDSSKATSKSHEDVKVVKPSTDVSRKHINPMSRKSPVLKPKLQPKQVSKFVSKIKPALKTRRDPMLASSSFNQTSARKELRATRLPDNMTKSCMAGGDTKQNLTKHEWAVLCQEERQKNVLLKQQLESESKLHKAEIDNIRMSFEQQLYSVKKENGILKAKEAELLLHEKQSNTRFKNDKKVLQLERELEKQENLIHAYETENKKLIQNTKRIQEDMKNLQQKQKSSVLDKNENEKLAERIKDLQEETLKLNLEISELKQKNADFALKNEDLSQHNGLLSDELEMFKGQLRAKNDFITNRLQAMTAAELESRKQIEDLTIKLSSKTEQLRTTKLELEKLQCTVLPLERELLELRIKEESGREKLQVAKSHVEREKQLTQKLKDQVILDNKKIMDLTRQVREMERILKRKNPDSVSALILSANSEHERIGTEKIKLLEERIGVLENEIKAKEYTAQRKLLDLQGKFTDMKDKYITQVAELEQKLLEVANREERNFCDVFTQTTTKLLEDKSVDGNKKEDKFVSFEKEERKEQKVTKVGPKSQNLKEDAHLIATIRGLKLELASKEKAMSKLSKEYQEMQKTNKRLQKEREKLLNDRRSFRNVDIERINRAPLSIDSQVSNSHSNVYQNGHVTDASSQRFSGSTQKLYNPMLYTENNENSVVKKLTDENEILKEELNKMNKDFMTLKNKRLHDLNLLQEEHERELAALVKEYSIKFGDSKVVKLQGQITTQVAIISHLKQQIEKLKDYKYQVISLKTEREHLESKVKTLSEKVKYLSTPSTEQLQLLQDKITLLQQRHESREMTLQTLVRDLLKSRTQCKDCKNEKGKNKQLCYFRQELDHILEMLQEIANVH